MCLKVYYYKNKKTNCANLASELSSSIIPWNEDYTIRSSSTQRPRFLLKPLCIASQNGHLPVVERLLQEKANPNTPTDDGVTSLYIASHEGHSPVVERLLQEKVDPNTPMDDGATPLYIASQEGQLCHLRTVINVQCACSQR